MARGYVDVALGPAGLPQHHAFLRGLPEPQYALALKQQFLVETKLRSGPAAAASSHENVIDRMVQSVTAHDTHAIMEHATGMLQYLDCAATTPIDPRVREEVLLYLDQEFGNAGSRTHDFGRRARNGVESARDRVAAVVAASRGDVFFTSGATESNNLAILGLYEHGRATGRTHVITSRIEHHAVLEPMAELERRGFEVTWLDPTPGGWIEASAVRDALRPQTLLVSIMHANNETGVLQPVAAIADAMGDHPAFLHVDAAQGFGKEITALSHPRIEHDLRERPQDPRAQGRGSADPAPA